MDPFGRWTNGRKLRQDNNLGRPTAYVPYNGSFVCILHGGIWRSVLCGEWPFLSLDAIQFGVTCLGNEQIRMAEGAFYGQQQ